jgi:hypothetical protein
MVRAAACRNPISGCSKRRTKDAPFNCQTGAPQPSLAPDRELKKAEREG